MYSGKLLTQIVHQPFEGSCSCTNVQYSYPCLCCHPYVCLYLLWDLSMYTICYCLLNVERQGNVNRFKFFNAGLDAARLIIMQFGYKTLTANFWSLKTLMKYGSGKKARQTIIVAKNWTRKTSKGPGCGHNMRVDFCFLITCVSYKVPTNLVLHWLTRRGSL